MLSDTWESKFEGNTSIDQDIFRPNPTMHQDLWAAQRTSCEDDFFLYPHRYSRGGRVLSEFDSHSIDVPSGIRVVREHDSNNCGFGEDL